MELGSIKAAPRKGDTTLRKWDFEVPITLPKGVKIKSITWTFDKQAKNIHTATGKAPGFVWTSIGSKTVSVVVIDSKGNKASRAITIIVNAPAPKPTPAPTQPSTGALTVYPLPGDLTHLGAGRFQAIDFDKGNNSKAKGAANYGALVNSNVRGAGSQSTVIEVKAHTSSKASAEPKVHGDGGGLANPTNNMYILRVDGNDRTVQGVTIQGTSQGHQYNGLRLNYNKNLTLNDVKVKDIPGNSSGNPGETFLINMQRTSGRATLAGVSVIGGSGEFKSAAGLGLNSVSAHVTIEGLLAQGLDYSAGIATWQQTGDMEIHGYVHDSPTRSFGAERLAASVHFYDIEFRQPRTIKGKHDATYTWGDHEAGNYKGGELIWEFSSEAALARALNSHRPVFYILTNSKSVSQGIKKSAHVIVAGKDRTSELLRWAGA